MNVAALVPSLYLLFTIRADLLAKATRFIRRVRAFTGSEFLQTLVFGWLRRPYTPLEHFATLLGISKQALDQHFSPQTAAFCKAILLEAVQDLFQARPQTLALLQPFQGVYVDDCTQLWLPAAACTDFPSTTLGQARLKVLLRWELQGGALRHLGLHPGKTGDLTTLEQAPPLPKGCLHLADMGFTDWQRLQEEDQAGVSWICRLPSQTLLFLVEPASLSRRRRLRQAADASAGVPLWRQLRLWRDEKRPQVDVSAWVGDKHTVAGRLVALACPPEVVAKRLAQLQRRAQDWCRPVTERQKELCHWTVLWTNVSVDCLTSEQVWRVYRLRWQIELLIKRFKSEGGLGKTAATKQERVESEWYLKLVGQIVAQQAPVAVRRPVACGQRPGTGSADRGQPGRAAASVACRCGSVVRCLVAAARAVGAGASQDAAA